MHYSSFSRIKKQWKFIFLLSLVVSFVFGLLALLMPLEYRADAEVLIISKTRFGVDPYTVVKSAERVGENVVKVMGSSDFFSKVYGMSEFGLNTKKYANLDEREKREKWAKVLSSEMVYGTGVLQIHAYDTSSKEAIKIAGAAAKALEQYGWEYVGGDVSFKVVNEPIASRFPARPNIPLFMLIGFFGTLLTTSFILSRK